MGSQTSNPISVSNFETFVLTNTKRLDQLGNPQAITQQKCSCIVWKLLYSQSECQIMVPFPCAELEWTGTGRSDEYEGHSDGVQLCNKYCSSLFLILSVMTCYQKLNQQPNMLVTSVKRLVSCGVIRPSCPAATKTQPGLFLNLTFDYRCFRCVLSISPSVVCNVPQ